MPAYKAPLTTVDNWSDNPVYKALIDKIKERANLQTAMGEIGAAGELPGPAGFTLTNPKNISSYMQFFRNNLSAINVHPVLSKLSENVKRGVAWAFTRHPAMANKLQFLPHETFINSFPNDPNFPNYLAGFQRVPTGKGHFGTAFFNEGLRTKSVSVADVATSAIHEYGHGLHAAKAPLDFLSALPSKLQYVEDIASLAESVGSKEIMNFVKKFPKEAEEIFHTDTKINPYVLNRIDEASSRLGNSFWEALKKAKKMHKSLLQKAEGK